MYCLQCGSPLSSNSSEGTAASAGIGGKKDMRESQQSQSPKPLKRNAMVLPAILIFIAVVFILVILSQSGVLDSLSSPGSPTVYQENILTPANETPTQTSSQASPQIPAVNPDRTSFLANIAAMEQTAMMNPSESSTATPMVTTVASTPQSTLKNIVETADADGRFTTFVTAVKAAGLDDTLSSDTMSGSEMFTVFAPTDDAFNKLSPGSMDTLLKDPQADLLQILLYHVVQGKVMAVGLKKLPSVETLQGGSLPISVSNGVITVDGANVIITDRECTNGVIHVVDTVMLPPA